MKRTLLFVALAASLLLSACVQQAPAPAAPQQVAAPTAAATPEPATAPTAAAPATEAPAVQPSQAATPAAQPATSAITPTLTSNPWQWAGFTSPVEQVKVEQPASYQLTFNSDGTVAVKADCNNATGSYKADDSSLTIQLGATTMAACPPDSRSDQYLKYLGSAAKYFFADGKLFISLMADGGIMRFDPAGAAAAPEAAPTDAAAALAAAVQSVEQLIANPWKWTAYSTGSEQGKVENPASYLLTFNQDGTVTIKADCNNAVGSYTLEGTELTMKVGPATLAACPPGSRSEQFMQLLNDVAQLLPAEGKLYVNLKTGGDAMQFDAQVTTVVDLCGDKALAVNKIDDTLDPQLSAMLDAGLVQLVQKGNHPGPGAVMLVITPKGRYLKSVGVSDVSTCAPLKADSPYEIGSNTKMMTSAMIYQLQEEGKLSTSDPLSKWLPDLAAKLPNGDKITVEMLLTHTSGMKDYFDVPGKDGSIADGVKNKEILTRAYTPEELVMTTANSGLTEFAPGAEGQWKYNNTGFILLGLIIEKATGKSYEENLKTRIFEPLGLKQTYLLTGVPKPGTLPQAYAMTPFDFTTSEWNASQGWSAGAVVSTPDEFATFMKALFTGKLFKQLETLKLMSTPAPTSADKLGRGVVYAHGMSINNGVLGHGGQTLGFESDGGYIPDKDVTIVIWSNASESNATRLIVPPLAAAVTGGGQ